MKIMTEFLTKRMATVMGIELLTTKTVMSMAMERLMMRMKIWMETACQMMKMIRREGPELASEMDEMTEENQRISENDLKAWMDEMMVQEMTEADPQECPESPGRHPVLMEATNEEMMERVVALIAAAMMPEVIKVLMVMEILIERQLLLQTTRKYRRHPQIPEEETNVVNEVSNAPSVNP